MYNANMLETERLLLRITTAEDYLNLYATSTEQDIMDYFGLTTEEQLQIEQNKIKGGMTTYRTSFLFFHLIEKQSNAIIGNCAYHNWYKMHSRSEIGYGMSSEDYKNKGFMKEAIKPIMEYGFSKMGLNRIEAFTHPENIASRKLLTGIGFKEEGLLKQHYCVNEKIEDSLVYGLLRNEYYRF
jgi:[ribosomal protein S5]-alanine N-acetyltransferase